MTHNDKQGVNPTIFPSLSQILVFCNIFILVRIVVDVEPVPGMMGMHDGYLHTHSHTNSHLGESKIANPTIVMFLGGWTKPVNLEETHVGNHVKLHTDNCPSSGSNPRFWRCKAAWYLHAASP